MKKYDVLIVLEALHKNLNFTVDTFDDKKVHFLDLLIDINTTDLFYKDTHTGQYTNYNSFMPWKHLELSHSTPEPPKSAAQNPY